MKTKEELIAAITALLEDAPEDVLRFVYHYIRYMTRDR